MMATEVSGDERGAMMVTAGHDGDGARMDRLACSWRRFRPSADSATVRSATCNAFSS